MKWKQSLFESKIEKLIQWIHVWDNSERVSMMALSCYRILAIQMYTLIQIFKLVFYPPGLDFSKQT